MERNKKPKIVEKKVDTFEIAPAEDVTKLTIEEAIDKGILPTPIELAKSPDEIVEYGRHAGTMYGYGVASIVSAVKRKDLPFKVRLAKGIRGLAFIWSMLLSAIDSYEKISELEDRVLLKKAVKEEAKTKDVDIDTLLDELERLKKEKERLEKELKSRKE